MKEVQDKPRGTTVVRNTSKTEMCIRNPVELIKAQGSFKSNSFLKAGQVNSVKRRW